MNKNNNGKIYNRLTIPTVPQQSNSYNYVSTFSKYGYISTNAFVVIQLDNGLWIRKNI